MKFCDANLVFVVIGSLLGCSTNPFQHSSHVQWHHIALELLCPPNNQIDIHQSRFHMMVRIATKMVCIVFDMNVMPLHYPKFVDVTPIDILACHIMHPRVGYTSPPITCQLIRMLQFPCLGCASCLSCASLEEALT